MFYLIRPLLKSIESGQIMTLKGQAMHYEPERACVMFPEVYFKRTDEADIDLDFIPMHGVTDGVVRLELALGPRLNTGRRRVRESAPRL